MEASVTHGTVEAIATRMVEWSKKRDEIGDAAIDEHKRNGQSNEYDRLEAQATDYLGRAYGLVLLSEDLGIIEDVDRRIRLYH